MGVSVPRHPQRWATGGLSDSGVQDAGDGSRVLSDVRRGGELFSAAAEDGGSRVAGQAAGVIYRAVLNVARSVLCCGIKKSEPMVIRTRNSPIYSETGSDRFGAGRANRPHLSQDSHEKAGGLTMPPDSPRWLCRAALPSGNPMSGLTWVNSTSVSGQSCTTGNGPEDRSGDHSWRATLGQS
jgi:hypothetical protein